MAANQAEKRLPWKPRQQGSVFEQIRLTDHASILRPKYSGTVVEIAIRSQEMSDRTIAVGRKRVLGAHSRSSLFAMECLVVLGKLPIEAGILHPSFCLQLVLSKVGFTNRWVALNIFGGSRHRS